MEVKQSEYGCKDCYHYDDCPMEYSCPAKEMIEEMLDHEGGIYIVRNGGLVGICPKEAKEE